MALIDFDLLQWNGSALGTRSISRKIEWGSLIHTRRVRTEAHEIFQERSPSFHRLALSLYEKEDPVLRDNECIKASFDYLVKSEQGKRDGATNRLYIEVKGIIPMKKPIYQRHDFFGLCIFGRGYVVKDVRGHRSHPKRKIKKEWKEFEIDYNIQHHEGTIYFMEKTTEPLRMEILSLSEVSEILKWRHGSNIIRFCPQKGIYQEFRVLEYGEPLDENYMKYPIVFLNSTFYIRCSHNRDIFGKEKRGKWIELNKQDGGFMFYALQERIDTLPPPYILANGEVHFQTSNDSYITSFPLSKAARGRLIKSEKAKPAKVV